MSNPTLDRAAEAIASARTRDDLAALEPVEQILIGKTAEYGDLDRHTIGAAWIILGDALAQIAANSDLTLQQAVNLAQLAGQRLYAGTGLPREVRCPQVYGSGAQCKHVVKGVADSSIDAQMQGHYATYHPDATWPPETSAAEQKNCIACLKPKDPFVSYGNGFMCAECALLQGVSSVNDVRRHFGMQLLTGDPSFDEPIDRRYFTRCSKCTKPVVLNGTTGQNAGHMTVEGILCGACNLDYKRRNAAIRAATEDAPEPASPLVHLPELDERGNPTGHALCDNGVRPVLPGTLSYGGPGFGKSEANCATCLAIDEDGDEGGS